MTNLISNATKTADYSKGLVDLCIPQPKGTTKQRVVVDVKDGSNNNIDLTGYTIRGSFVESYTVYGDYLQPIKNGATPVAATIIRRSDDTELANYQFALEFDSEDFSAYSPQPMPDLPVYATYDVDFIQPSGQQLGGIKGKVQIIYNMEV